MKSFLSFIIVFYLIFSIIPNAYSLPAKLGEIKASQPDGSNVTVRLEGNEHHKRIYSLDGYLLTTDSLGYYVYADIDSNGFPVPTDIKAQDIENRDKNTIKRIERLKGIYESYPERAGGAEISTRGIGSVDPQFIAYGEQRVLVILVEFADKKFTIENPQEYYFRMLNEAGFADHGATGSAKDYFISNSSGLFVPQFDVYGPVELGKNYSYYGKNDFWGYDKNPHEMVIEACGLLNDEIDFTIYDSNKDGVIDNVYVFYAGYGEADGGGANTIWPHSYDIDFVSFRPYIFDGIRLNHYACSNELQKANDMPDGIGTFCHEFSHVMGLPDLYSTTYNSAFTPLYWDILDQGSYNNLSRTPPNYSSFERYALDWILPEPLTEGAFLLSPLNESNQAYIVNTEDDDEFFLFENRQQSGFDSFIPGHGMLIWHIDFDRKKWIDNTVNNTPGHQNVDLIEADNIRTPETFDGDPFPGVNNVSEFSYNTIPAFITWKKENMPFRLFEITENEDNNITFNVEEYELSGMELNSISSEKVLINGKIITCSGKGEIFSADGRKIATLKDDSLQLSSGVYIFKGNEIIKILVK